ncbi:MAG: hypothetical protein LBJ60_03325 [Tannerellaceae bacterium]|jgi:hypothetical protein|nr:hypothetical protein [Tannerellaceae bacterium]
MKTDKLFIDGLLPRNESISYLYYLLPLATVLEENGFSFKILNLTLLDDYSLDRLHRIILGSQINIIGNNLYIFFKVKYESTRLANKNNLKSFE